MGYDYEILSKLNLKKFYIKYIMVSKIKNIVDIENLLKHKYYLKNSCGTKYYFEIKNK